MIKKEGVREWMKYVNACCQPLHWSVTFLSLLYLITHLHTLISEWQHWSLGLNSPQQPAVAPTLQRWSRPPAGPWIHPFNSAALEWKWNPAPHSEMWLLVSWEATSDMARYAFSVQNAPFSHLTAPCCPPSNYKWTGAALSSSTPCCN